MHALRALAAPRSALTRAPPEPRPDGTVGLTPGTIIAGRFEIVAPLGAGSMGEVYQAHDLKLHRDVALKLLSTALAESEEHLKRFEREARAASALNHPNICTIYDVGHASEAGNRPYLVMELVRGLTLFEVLAAGPLAIRTIVNLGVQLADALDAAHSAGIVHRDLKPANVFVTARGDAKLLDFGLAAISEAAASGTESQTLLTNPGTTVGTVLYMSPEQALGDPTDARTDLFSLGVVLYEMVTGRRAFEARSTTAIVDAILHDMPLGLRAGESSSVPKPLRMLLTRMLDKDRERRPATAAEVAAHLRAIQSGSIAGREYAAAAESVSGAGLPKPGSDIFRAPRSLDSSPPPSAPHTWTREVRAGGLRPIAVAVFALLVVAFTASWWVRGRPLATTPPEPLLLAEFSNSTGEAVFDGALRDALEIQLQQSPHVNVVPAAQVRAALQLMERAPTEPITPAVAHDLCQRLGVKAVLLGSIAPLGSEYVITLDAQACRTGESIAREQTQAKARTEVLGSVGAAAVRVRERLGESIGSIERFNVPAPDATTSSLEALKAYSMGVETRIKTGDVQAIPLFEHALELDPDFALAAARLGAIYTNLGELAQARSYTQRAFARSDSLSAPERFFIKSHYHYSVTGRLDEAVATLRLWAETYPHDWVPHNNLSDTYERLGQVDAALDEARTAVRLGPSSVVPYQQLARVLIGMDRLAEAAATLQDAFAKGLESSTLRVRALDLAFIAGDRSAERQHLGSAGSRPDAYLVLTEAARVAAARGDFERARVLYGQAALSARAANMNEFVASLSAEEALADALAGRRARAEANLRQALATSSGPDAAWNGALAAAFAGSGDQAARLKAAYEKLAPRAPDVVTVAEPILQAAVALARREPRLALDALDRSARSEPIAGPWLPYLRGLAQMALGDNASAAAQFQTVNARQGRQPLSLVRPLARLQLARALKATGDTSGARAAYEHFLNDWKDGDPDLPVLHDARAEAAALR